MQLKVKAVFFYADIYMLASTNLGWLHTAFDMLKVIIDQVGLKTNIRKIVGVVCQP